jgi:hypothetical protein
MSALPGGAPEVVIDLVDLAGRIGARIVDQDIDIATDRAEPLLVLRLSEVGDMCVDRHLVR